MFNLKMGLLKTFNRIPFKEIFSDKIVLQDLSKPIDYQYQLPINQIFKVFNFNYKNDPSSMALHCNNNWLDHLILLNFLFNILRNLLYTILDSNDQMFRLYCGDLIQFADGETAFITIALGGLTCNSTAMFCLFHYSSVNQLKWLNIFNAVEGKQSFVKSKILMTKSAKKFIKICLIFTTFSIASIYFMPISTLFIFFILSLLKLSFETFLLYAFPWIIINTIWGFYCWGYGLFNMFSTIICYYYKLRLHQLDVYAKWLLKQDYNRLNHGIIKLLKQYEEVMTEVNEFNKFGSKLIFFIFSFLVSTDVFLIYNIIYVQLNAITLYGHFLGVLVFSSFSLIIILSSIVIPNQFSTNKRKLIKLIYKKNFQITVKIKVIILSFVIY